MNLGRENEYIEFKKSTAEFDTACKAIVAMLNKNGSGKIYFGVKDNGEVVGHLIGQDTLSTLTDRIKDSIKPAVYPIIAVEEYDNKQVITISFQGSNKPYAYKGAFYIRVEQENLVVDPLVLRELIKDSHEYNQNWENDITQYGVNDIDENAVDLFYRQSVAMGRMNKYEHTASELLTQLGLLIDGHLTNAGFYLFSNKAKLVYKAVIYPTTERLNPIDLKRFEGNIFNLINEAISYINEKMNWKVVFTSIQRIEVPELPVEAIREIVINSLVHCDYYGDSEHQITIDPEVIEIYNPGYFGEFTPIDYVERNLPSRTKHKVIQGVIFKAFDVETLGRGIKRTDVTCKSRNIKWSYEKFSFGFSFKFYRKSFGIDISNDAEKLYKKIKENDGTLDSIEEAMKMTGKKSRSTYSLIDELIKNNKLKRIGSRKNGYWIII